MARTSLALAGLALLAMMGAATAQSLTIDTKPKRNVCLVYYQAIVYCEPGQDPSEYNGYEVELFKRSADFLYQKGQLEWAPDNYTFTCMGWDDLMTDLYLPDDQRTCDVGVAGISATSDRIQAGLKFTMPTYKSGRLIMIYAPDKIDMFGFLNPFSPGVWLLMFGTSVFVGVVVMFAEVPIRRIISRPKPCMTKYMNLQWASTAMMLQAVQQFSTKSAGARIIILAYAFVVLILINAYIAVLSSQLTVTSIALNIKGLSDLTSKPVGIFDADITAFKRFSLGFAVPLPWNSAEDEANMLEKLRSQEVTALVLDAPFVEYQVAAACDFYTVGDLILPVNLGFAFPSSTDLDYIEGFNLAMISLEESGVTEDLRSRWISPPGGCTAKADSSSLANAQITIPRVAGLWVFLGVAVATGYLLNMAMWAWNKWRGNDEEDIAGAASMRLAGDLPGGAGSLGGGGSRNKVAPGNNSLGSMAGGRSMSFFRANPELSWVGVADASTTEEALEVVEGYIRTMDTRIKTLTTTLENRFAILNENLFGLNARDHDALPLPATTPRHNRKGSVDPAGGDGSYKKGVGFPSADKGRMTGDSPAVATISIAPPPIPASPPLPVVPSPPSIRAPSQTTPVRPYGASGDAIITLEGNSNRQ